MANVVTLKINDKDVSGRDDETILEIARQNGIPIPTMCQLKGLSNIGACRMCLVAPKGSNRLMASCSTTVQEGMDIETETPMLLENRKMIIEMMFVEGNHICSVCVSNGHCELQNMAQIVKIDHIEMAYRNPERDVDASHPRFTFDHNRCILCARCVRVCDEVEGAHVWDIMGRGIEAKVITEMNQPWGSATSCTSCGKCVQVCPTGALFEKGKAVGEMTKRRNLVGELVNMRESRTK
jgi:bidirectional [NiFe] hydrogenase diaphorase subunit